MRSARIPAIVNQNGVGNPASAWIPVDQLFAFSATGVLTGSMAGTLKVQVSNDPLTTAQANIVGFDLPTVSVTIAAGSSGVIPAVTSAYVWARLVFTTSGGAGNVTAVLKASGF